MGGDDYYVVRIVRHSSYLFHHHAVGSAASSSNPIHRHLLLLPLLSLQGVVIFITITITIVIAIVVRFKIFIMQDFYYESSIVKAHQDRQDHPTIYSALDALPTSSLDWFVFKAFPI